MILDATCGSRAMYEGWHTKLNEDLICIDRRRADFSFKSPSNWVKSNVKVAPSIQADLRFLPFKDNIFNMILFDPPHTANVLESIIAKKYGSWDDRERVRTLRVANKEFPRVLKVNGFLILKTFSRQFPIFEALLKNFVFFLPIRMRTGAFKSKKRGQYVLWAIGQVKK